MTPELFTQREWRHPAATLTTFPAPSGRVTSVGCHLGSPEPCCKAVVAQLRMQMIAVQRAQVCLR